MKTLYLDCSMGAAGDMLSAALWELLNEQQKQDYLEQINSLGLPGVSVQAEKEEKCGIFGTHMSVTVNGEEETENIIQLQEHLHGHEHTDEHHHDHEHTDEHHHHHSHHSLSDILKIIGSLSLPEKIKEEAADVYSLISQAEAKVHHCDASEVHFHEAGSLDAVTDVVGFCLLLNMLCVDKVIASPVHVGKGSVRCAHGVLPVPAPATAEILKDIPTYSGEIEGELCTPTGAALLSKFCTAFTAQPVMKIQSIGYGMGTKDFARCNCLRALLGEEEENMNAEELTEICCNIDDMSGEELAFLQSQLWQTGAKDVWSVPIYMKKNRPAVQICCLCDEKTESSAIKTMLRNSSTWGVRSYKCHRYSVEREFLTVETRYGAVNVKTGDGKWKAEYEDLEKIAVRENVPIRDIKHEVEKAMAGR